MPKRSKPRKPNTTRKNQEIASSASPKSAKRQKVVKYAAVAIVVALVASFLIGALSASPAKAAELAGGPTPAATTVAEPDTDGDGIINNADEDIDGDGVVNGIDPDIDGDGAANGTDGDPAATNGGVIAPPPTNTNNGLPGLIPAELQTPTGRLSIAAVILLIGATIIWARRRHK